MAGIISELIGEGAAGLVNAVGDQINKKTEVAADLAKTEIQADAQVAVAQNQVNQAEASGDDKYTKRARPTIMYICGAGFAYQYILQPLLMYYAIYIGKALTLPSLDMSAISTVLLGLCGMRSFDKMKK